MAQIERQITCTPTDLLHDFACLKCLSKLELEQLLLVILCDLTGSYDLPDDTHELLDDTACWTCISDTQRLQAIVSMFAQLTYAGTDTTVDDIRDKIKCLLCANPAQIKGAIAALLCSLCNNNITPN